MQEEVLSESHSPVLLKTIAFPNRSSPESGHQKLCRRSSSIAADSTNAPAEAYILVCRPAERTRLAVPRRTDSSSTIETIGASDNGYLLQTGCWPIKRTAFQLRAYRSLDRTTIISMYTGLTLTKEELQAPGRNKLPGLEHGTSKGGVYRRHP